MRYHGGWLCDREGTALHQRDFPIRLDRAFDIAFKKYDGKDWERSHKKTNIASESEFDEDDADDVLI